jgi:hypothetical protein
MHEFLNYHRHRHRHRRREEEEEEERNKKRTTIETTRATDGGNVNGGNGNGGNGNGVNGNDNDDDDDDDSNNGDGTTHPASSSSAANDDDDDEAVVDVSSLLPRHLARLVRHHHGEFYVSRSFDPNLVVHLMAQGFLPIATLGYLLPKLHAARCVVRLLTSHHHPPEEDNSKGGNRCCCLHVSRSVRRRSGKFEIGLNERFDEVVAGCHRQQ